MWLLLTYEILRHRIPDSDGQFDEGGLKKGGIANTVWVLWYFSRSVEGSWMPEQLSGSIFQKNLQLPALVK